jgi:hypothetical protein
VNLTGNGTASHHFKVAVDISSLHGPRELAQHVITFTKAPPTPHARRFQAIAGACPPRRPPSLFPLTLNSPRNFSRTHPRCSPALAAPTPWLRRSTLHTIRYVQLFRLRSRKLETVRAWRMQLRVYTAVVPICEAPATRMAFLPSQRIIGTACLLIRMPHLRVCGALLFSMQFTILPCYPILGHHATRRVNIAERRLTVSSLPGAQAVPGLGTAHPE